MPNGEKKTRWHVYLTVQYIILYTYAAQISVARRKRLHTCSCTILRLLPNRKKNKCSGKRSSRIPYNNNAILITLCVYSNIRSYTNGVTRLRTTLTDVFLFFFFSPHSVENGSLKLLTGRYARVLCFYASIYNYTTFCRYACSSRYICNPQGRICGCR